MSTLTENDLLIIGAGALGSRVAKLWRTRHPTCTIIAETRTKASHNYLQTVGATPTLANEETRAFPTVLFCVPPSPYTDYTASVLAAVKRVQPHGRFVFTSSTSVYGDVAFANEQTPPTTEGRGRKMSDAEGVVLGTAQGVVIRLPGLYAVDQGGHLSSFESGKVYMGRGRRWNFLHYDDAAEAVARVLGTQERGTRVFLACAKAETSTEDYMDGLLRHPRFAGVTRPVFLNEGEGGRRHDGEVTRALLGWKPRYETVDDFVDSEIGKAG